MNEDNPCYGYGPLSSNNGSAACFRFSPIDDHCYNNIICRNVSVIVIRMIIANIRGAAGFDQSGVTIGAVISGLNHSIVLGESNSDGCDRSEV